MIETLMMVLMCLGFLVVSIALAFSFAMNAYLDWMEASVAIEHGIRIITERNKDEQQQGADDEDPLD